LTISIAHENDNFNFLPLCGPYLTTGPLDNSPSH